MKLFEKDILMNSDSSVIEKLNALKVLDKKQFDKDFCIAISSNIVISNIETFFKIEGYLNDIKVNVILGEYDDLVSDFNNFSKKKFDLTLVVNLFDNLIPSFESRVKDKELVEKVYDQYFKKLTISIREQHNEILLFKFFPITSKSNEVNQIIEKFNLNLENFSKNYSNIKLFDASPIAYEFGVTNLIDFRFYYRNKAPFNSFFQGRLAKKIAIETKYFETTFKKVLVLDCDNTIWGGIVGEDLISGIKLDPYTYPGNIFYKFQLEIKALVNDGVLLCLISKNNEGDVLEVLEHHQYSILNEKLIVAKKINWIDKVENLKELSKELNLGLESFVFVDDSDFECQNVKERLPEVAVVQFPKLGFEVTKTLQVIKSFFQLLNRENLKNYKLRELAIDLERNSVSKEDYIKSLKIQVKIEKDNSVSSNRLSELSLKSNQFNLTTKRYKVSDIDEMIKAEDFSVFSISVSDTFGDSGLTGIVIVRINAATSALIDSFLMSCRVLGRGIEVNVLASIARELKKSGFHRLDSEYIPSPKNKQVEFFYDDNKFDHISTDENKVKLYRLNLIEANFTEDNNMSVCYE